MSGYITKGFSIRGISHNLKNTPNQDSYKIIEEENLIILAIADGHGGKAHIRSDVGSKLATL